MIFNDNINTVIFSYNIHWFSLGVFEALIILIIIAYMRIGSFKFDIPERLPVKKVVLTHYIYSELCRLMRTQTKQTVDFSEGITQLYQLGLITAREKNNLHTFRTQRNKFVHGERWDISKTSLKNAYNILVAAEKRKNQPKFKLFKFVMFSLLMFVIVCSFFVFIFIFT